MKNNNYENTANSIIRNTIDGFETYIVLLLVGLSEIVTTGIIVLPILLLLDYFHSPLFLQWGFVYVMLVLSFLFWSIVGWTQSRFIGIFITIMNIVLFILMILATK